MLYALFILNLTKIILFFFFYCSYIYGGIILLNEHDISEISKVFLAADQLHLQELVNYLQSYLIENESKWVEHDFELIRQTSFQSNSFLKLQQYCTELMVRHPENIFRSFDFISLSEESFISLI